MASTSAGPSSIRDALRRVSTDHGIDPIAEPQRATAVVADLVAAPGADSAATVTAVRSVLRSLARRRSDGLSLDPESVAQDARRDGVPEDLARTTVSSVFDALDVDAVPARSSRPRWAVFGGVAAVLAAAAFVVSQVTDDTVTEPSAAEQPGEDEARAEDEAGVDEADVDEAGGEDVGGDEAEVPAPEPDPGPPPTENEEQGVPSDIDGLTASFAPVREGAFLVQRTWEVSAEREELVGTIRLTSADGTPTAVGHREIPPLEAIAPGAEPTWSPSPTTMNGAVAVHAGVAVSGDEAFEFTYRMPLELDDGGVERADLLAWFEAWRPLAEAVRSPLDASDPLEAPQVTTLP